MESLKERIIKSILASKKLDKGLVEKIASTSTDFKEFRDSLIRNNILNDEDILLIFAREYRMPYLDLDKYKVSKENKTIISKELALRYKVLPISRIGEALTLATANPLDIVALDDIRIATTFKKIDLVLAKEDKIIRALNNLYSEEVTSLLEEDQIEDVSIKEMFVSEGTDLETMLRESKLPPIVRVVDLMVYEALKRRASDIHIEPTETGLGIRYRVDGVLQDGLLLPKRSQPAILARLKLMSSLNITEFRVPQDGRFKVKFEGREIDFRVSSLPTQFGEKIVARVLDRESLSTGLKALGFSEIPLRLFEEALRAPFGIVLVTGPTGSGKSTTLYSIINQLNSADKNIITIEDPVEYQVEGITQVQVKPEIGLTFAACLRSVLRQSPDIIMIGEIRDAETVDIAIKASLTGQFIFSTLHTNTAVGAIIRLIDMGIEPFLLASSLVATTAQRLVRKLCQQCKIKEAVDKSLLKRFGLDSGVEELFRPKGCKYCNNKGYRGRTALMEILPIDDRIREMIIKRASEDEIIAYARQSKEFSSFKEDGFKKCLEGITSLEEVLRVAG